jgi:hypothetical protein
MSKIQSIIFMKNHGWTKRMAEYWLKINNFKPIKQAHFKGFEIRYRIREPKFRYYITKKLRNGIMFVIGFK